ncbi:MAG: hypothetical protein H6714_09565 [Myxococcales bacterium]|nr:hypothetical protein [Myxococcales bacterium]
MKRSHSIFAPNVQLRTVTLMMCAVAWFGCGGKDHDRQGDADPGDVPETGPIAPSFCDPSIPYEANDAGRQDCVECRAIEDEDTCNQEPLCAWYFCKNRGQTPLGCYPKASNRGKYCIGPCEYWADQSACNAALRCLWFADACRSADVTAEAAEKEPDPACHERTDTASCSQSALCASANCASYSTDLSDLPFLCWLGRRGGNERSEQACLEQQCENLLNEAACTAHGARCTWRDDNRCGATE